MELSCKLKGGHAGLGGPSPKVPVFVEGNVGPQRGRMSRDEDRDCRGARKPRTAYNHQSLEWKRWVPFP